MAPVSEPQRELRPSVTKQIHLPELAEPALKPPLAWLGGKQWEGKDQRRPRKISALFHVSLQVRVGDQVQATHVYFQITRLWLQKYFLLLLLLIFLFCFILFWVSDDRRLLHSCLYLCSSISFWSALSPHLSHHRMLPYWGTTRLLPGQVKVISVPTNILGDVPPSIWLDNKRLWSLQQCRS